MNGASYKIICKHKHLQRKHTSRRQRITNGSKVASCNYWVTMDQLWLDGMGKSWCNKDLHGVDERSCAQAKTQEVHRKLRELYKRQANLSTEVQTLMYGDVLEHFDRPLWVTGGLQSQASRLSGQI